MRENCLNCHDPHGSTKEFLLKVQRPKLCAECHGFDHGTNLLGPTNSRFIFNKGCGKLPCEDSRLNASVGGLLPAIGVGAVASADA